MQISKRQFEVLTTIEEKGNISQREISKIIDYSLGTTNNTIKELSENGLIENGNITNLGLNTLEQYRVKKAIIIAAGFGSRLMPITLNTPKPLVRVNGTRIIDTLLDAILEAEIKDITIVRGYLAEQFDQLLYKYPMIKFVENKNYNESNNISSLMCVKNELENTYIFEADLYLSNKKLIKKYQYNSNFLGIKMDRSDDWCFEVENEIIKKQKVGGENVYQEVGISYWNKEDGIKLSNDIESVYNMPGGHERFWDEIVFNYFSNNYSVGIRKCNLDDVVEIDTFKELQSIDKSYSMK